MAVSRSLYLRSGSYGLMGVDGPVSLFPRLHYLDNGAEFLPASVCVPAVSLRAGWTFAFPLPAAAPLAKRRLFLGAVEGEPGRRILSRQSGFPLHTTLRPVPVGPHLDSA